jgi:hypothetical protein
LDSELVPNLSVPASADEHWEIQNGERAEITGAFQSRGAGVESSEPNFVQPLRQHVADMKHGFSYVTG